MEPERPFKHVEVIDSRTGTKSKVACMACIRGHRASSCGNPSCQQKVYWTVKRPGRPSNVCTCRFGASGRCKCHVVQTACPHRVKGAKRSADCRCEEQGRYCCYIEPYQWEEMYALRNPRVDFYPTREDLDAAHPTPFHSVLSPTPSMSAATPRTMNSMPSTPKTAESNGLHPTTFNSPPDSSGGGSKGVRFGMMGVGGPWGDDTTTPEDVFQWQGLAPEAPPDYNLFSATTAYHTPTPTDILSPTSLNQQPQSNSTPTQPYTFLSQPEPNQPSQTEFLPPAMTSFEDLSTFPTTCSVQSSLSDIDRFMQEYLNHQVGLSAICQSCGLNGCTCRNCPPVMQNTSNGSWGSGCARKHFRPGKAAVATTTTTASSTFASRDSILHANGTEGLSSLLLGTIDPSLPSTLAMSDLHMTSPDENGLPGIPENGCCGGAEPMSLSDLLMEDLDGIDDDDGGGGGCCCSGG